MIIFIDNNFILMYLYDNVVCFFLFIFFSGFIVEYFFIIFLIIIDLGLVQDNDYYQKLCGFDINLVFG